MGVMISPLQPASLEGNGTMHPGVKTTPPLRVRAAPVEAPCFFRNDRLVRALLGSQKGCEERNLSQVPVSFPKPHSMIQVPKKHKEAHRGDSQRLTRIGKMRHIVGDSAPLKFQIILLCVFVRMCLSLCVCVCARVCACTSVEVRG